MSVATLWGTPWVRGLMFGSGIGLVVGIVTLLSPPTEERVGGGAGVSPGPGGAARMAAGDSPSGPRHSPRELGLLAVAQEYSMRRMWPEADAAIGKLDAGAARDEALDTLIQEKTIAGLPDPGQPLPDPAASHAWLDALRKDAERMGDSPRKVGRLIKLATVDTDLARRLADASGDPKPTVPPVGKDAPRLLARAAEVAAATPGPVASGSASGLGRPLLYVAAFGLLGMASGWVASTSKGHRAGPSSAGVSP